MQFFDRALGFLDGLHLDESKAFRPLVVAVADYLRVLDVADAIKELEQVALCGIEGQIAHIKSRRRNFDRLRFTLRPLLLLLLLRCTISGWAGCFCRKR